MPFPMLAAPTLKKRKKGVFGSDNKTKRRVVFFSFLNSIGLKV